jgi:hypothetical protein
MCAYYIRTAHIQLQQALSFFSFDKVHLRLSKKASFVILIVSTFLPPHSSDMKPQFSLRAKAKNAASAARKVEKKRPRQSKPGILESTLRPAMQI